METHLTDPVTMSPEHRRALRRIRARGEAFLRDRDRAVRAARADGATFREIGTEVGLSHIGVRDIVNKPEPPEVEAIEGDE